jgi:hypothetical protein
MTASAGTKPPSVRVTKPTLLKKGLASEIGLVGRHSTWGIVARRIFHLQEISRLSNGRSHVDSLIGDWGTVNPASSIRNPPLLG